MGAPPFVAITLRAAQDDAEYMDTGIRDSWVQLGSLLIEQGRITVQQLEEALYVQEQTGQLLGEILVARGYLTPPALSNALAEQ